MKTYARVIAGVVAEIIRPFRWDIPGDPRDGIEVPLEDRFPFEFCQQCVEASQDVASGWLYANGKFKAPPAPAVPKVEVVTMRQARLALIDAGVYAQVAATIAGMQGAIGERAQVEWDSAATVERGSPIVGMLAQALSLNSTALDDLFLAASKL